MCGTCSNSGCGGCGDFSVPQGDAGLDGWSPVFAVVSDGPTREVLQLQNWTGGTGTNPGHINEYISTSGFTATIGAAANIRGTDGTDGRAFIKYVKEFTTTEIEQDLTVSFAEWTACGEPDDACTVGTPNALVDIIVSVMWRPNNTSNWVQLAGRGSALSVFDYQMSINYTTGLITITTASNEGLYRVIVIA